MTISKSEYMMFLKHPAWLWLKKNDPSKIPQPDAGLQARFDEGNLFEQYAYQLFPNAVELGYKTNGEFDGRKYNELLEKTKIELENNTPVIFQGRLEKDNLTVIFDILERVIDNLYDLYEVKSSTEVKPEHIDDLAFQTLVLQKSGLEIRNVFVLHVNNQYVRNGVIDPNEIVSKEDVTDQVLSKIDETEDNAEKAIKYLSTTIEPDFSPRHLKSGAMKDWLKIFENVKGVLLENSIYNLCGVTAKQTGLLEDMAIELIDDIPDDFKLSLKQREYIQSLKEGRKINKEEINKFLNGLEYPLYFFDYETFSGVIPFFDGMRPYQQGVFQYSLHILESPDSELIHKEYLHLDNSDPSRYVVEQMRKDFGDTGTVITWNETFEKGRNKELAQMFPEYENFLIELNERMVDLMIPFKQGWFTDSGFKGSASLKYVSPVLIKNFGYKDLDIAEGGTAQRTWMDMVLKGIEPKNKEKAIEDLLKYCGFDTEVMYLILKVLEESVNR